MAMVQELEDNKRGSVWQGQAGSGSSDPDGSRRASHVSGGVQWRGEGRVPDAQNIMIEIWVGWEGATEGFREVFDRVVWIDNMRHRIGDKGWTQPDFLREFLEAGEWEA